MQTTKLPCLALITEQITELSLTGESITVSFYSNEHLHLVQTSAYITALLGQKTNLYTAVLLIPVILGLSVFLPEVLTAKGTDKLLWTLHLLPSTQLL